MYPFFLWHSAKETYKVRVPAVEGRAGLSAEANGARARGAVGLDDVVLVGDDN